MLNKNYQYFKFAFQDSDLFIVSLKKSVISINSYKEMFKKTLLTFGRSSGSPFTPHSHWMIIYKGDGF